GGAGGARLGLGGCGGRDAQQRERDEARRRGIVREDVALRKGNATSYPARFAPKLPRGVEARELPRRGGWVQVELAGGAVGWLPGGAVLTLTAGGRGGCRPPAPPGPPPGPPRAAP